MARTLLDLSIIENVWGEFFGTVYQGGQNRNTKKFYQKISNQNRHYRPKTNGIRNKEGKIVMEDKLVKEAWIEYFAELLNKNSTQEAVINDTDEIIVQEPTIEEVKQVISSSRNSKVPGKDGINAELIKYGGEKLAEHIYELVSHIWKEERIPHDWEVGQIVTIYKKGDKHECKNYRGITLLNTAYKIISTIIQKRLCEVSENIIGQYQFGFMKGKSTTDAIHVIKQIIEKAHEYKMELEILFIDFQQAFDSIDRTELMTALKELKIPVKLRRLIYATMKETKVSIKTQKGDTEEFRINKGVKQGDSLSAMLFNMAIEYVTRTINKGTIRSRGGQLVAYADDLALITKRRDIMTNMLEVIIEEGKKIGLKINDSKTKIMRLGKELGNKKIKIGSHEFEQVDKFRYLGIMLSSDGDRVMEIKEKIISANKALHANKKLLKSKILTRKTKIRIYKTLIRPIITYAAETMTMTKKEEERLRIAERKIMRTILGPVRVTDKEYRIRTNLEIEQELKGDDIVGKIKEQRLRWLGHVWRANREDVISTIMDWEPAGRRRQGRPRSTWIQEVKEDLKRIGVSNARNKAMNRTRWREICREIGKL